MDATENVEVVEVAGVVVTLKVIVPGMNRASEFMEYAGQMGAVVSFNAVTPTPMGLYQ